MTDQENKNQENQENQEKHKPWKYSQGMTAINRRMKKAGLQVQP